MKNVLLICLLLSTTLVFSQSILRSDYSNIGSAGLNLGISENTGNDDNILHLGIGNRYRIINTGLELSSTLGDSLLTINNLYVSAKFGFGIPVVHFKRGTVTINANGTYNLFDRLDNENINGKFGYETYAKLNTAFVNVELGYSGNPDSDNTRLYRKGAYVKLSVGLNEFFSREEGWSISNYYEGDEKTIRKGNKVQGTGFAISEGGYILTSYHVVKNGKKVEIYGIDGNMEDAVEAEVVTYDQDADLAILKVKDIEGNIPFGVKIKESVSGKKVYTLGYPNQHFLGGDVKITEGIINATSGYNDDNSLYQISTAVTNGNSGGPLFDSYGNVIGVITSGYRDKNSDLINYAVKASYIQPLLQEAAISSISEQDYNTDEVDGSTIANVYNKYVYVIIVEH